MRRLIRFALFVVARLGLFFAVVSWVLGQWWAFSAAVPFQKRTLSIACYDGAWGLNTIAFRISEPFSLRVLRPDDFHSEELDSTITDIAPGISYEDAGIFTSLSFRHWLVISSFALFYGVLKFAGRGDSRVRPPDTTGND